MPGWLDPALMERNLSMLRNLFDPLLEVAAGLQHVSLMHGTKAYGLHHPAVASRVKVSLRECEPRLEHPNFYFLQEDYLLHPPQNSPVGRVCPQGPDRYQEPGGRARFFRLSNAGERWKFGVHRLHERLPPAPRQAQRHDGPRRSIPPEDGNLLGLARVRLHQPGKEFNGHPGSAAARVIRRSNRVIDAIVPGERHTLLVTRCREPFHTAQDAIDQQRATCNTADRMFGRANERFGVSVHRAVRGASA